MKALSASVSSMGNEWNTYRLAGAIRMHMYGGLSYGAGNLVPVSGRVWALISSGRLRFDGHPAEERVSQKKKREQAKPPSHAKKRFEREKNNVQERVPSGEGMLLDEGDLRRTALRIDYE